MKKNLHSGNKKISKKLSSLKFSEKEFVELVSNVYKIAITNEKILEKLEQMDSKTLHSGKKKQTYCALGWTGNSEQLKVLHNGLVKIGYIKIDFCELITHFAEDPPQCKKIQWHSSEARLVYIMEELKTHGLIKFEKGRFKTISEHFLNSNGCNYKPHQLSSVLDQIKVKKQTQFKKLEKLIENVLKIQVKVY